MVNGYMNLIKTTAPAGVLILDSFLYQLVSTSIRGNNGIARVLAHTRKVCFIVTILPWVCLNTLFKINIFDYHLVLIPMNVDGNHWVGCEVDLNKNRVSFFDSLHRLNKSKVAGWEQVRGQYKYFRSNLMLL